MTRISLAIAMVLTVLVSFSQNLTELQTFRGSDTPNGSGDSDSFGQRVRLSGNTAIISAPSHNGRRGAVYVFELSNNLWTEVAKLTASDAKINVEFGTSIAIEGDVIVVGNGSIAFADQGAYIFEKPVSGWTNMTETIKLNTPAPENTSSTSAFGLSVDINQSEILIGAPYEDNGGIPSGGRIYLYEKSGSSWATAFLRAELTTTNVGSGDFIGFTAKLEDDYVVSSALTGAQAGTLHVFERPASGTWANATVEDIILYGSDRSTYDQFGGILGTSDDRIIVAGFFDGLTNSDMNWYAFEKENALWSTQSTQTEQYLNNLPSYFPYAGFSASYYNSDAAFQSTIALLGNGDSAGPTQGNSSACGSVYIIDFTTFNVDEIDGLGFASNGFFGSSVDIEGSKVLISSPGETTGGVVRYFDLSYHEQSTQSLCPGSSIMLGSQTITDPGVYMETFIAVNGLDSLVELTVESPLQAVISDASTSYGTPINSGLTVTLDPNDNLSTHFKISNIQGGTLFKSDAVTQIIDGNYITTAEGASGLVFDPDEAINSSFEVEAGVGTDGSCLGAATTVNITVNKASLMVTTDDIAITVEDAVPSSFELIYSGFVNSEDESVLDTEPTASTTATAGNSGMYDILISGGSDNNYDLQFVNGTLTIEEILSTFSEDHVSIYPNPTSDFLAIDAKLKSIRLLDLNGKELINQVTNILDISGLKEGTYILQLEDVNGQKSSHRIVKQ